MKGWGKAPGEVSGDRDVLRLRGARRMSKYQPLADHLAVRCDPFWRADFEELEAILGFPLPKAAHATSSWWANSPDKPHHNAWLASGWEVESVDRAGKAVLFHKQSYQPEDELPDRYFRRAASAPLEGATGGQVKRMMGLTAVVGGVVAVAAGVGALALKSKRKRR
jgi:hypothetical protein